MKTNVFLTLFAALTLVACASAGKAGDACTTDDGSGLDAEPDVAEKGCGCAVGSSPVNALPWLFGLMMIGLRRRNGGHE